MFATGWLRSDTSKGRWRDPAWLAWAGMAAYLLHNVEEYGVDATGAVYSFPGFMGANVGGIPDAVYLSINVPMFWIAAAAIALLARRLPAAALALPSIEFVNALGHIAQGFNLGYNPGLATAVVLFVPLFCWICHALLSGGYVRGSGVAAMLGIGLLSHVLMLAGLFSAVLGPVPFGAVVVWEFANAAICYAIVRFASAKAAQAIV